MVSVHLVTALAQKETAKQSLLNQLREAGATSPQMPGSLEIDDDEEQTALAELMAAGTVKEARPGAYYLGETATKTARPGLGFIALLAILIVLSFMASLVAIALTQG